jgi:hypothetical protein
MHKDDLSRRVRLDVTKDGAVFIRKRGESADGALPVFSTNTRAQAESIRVLHCRLARDRSGIYRANEFSGEVEDLDRVADMFRDTYARRNPRAAQRISKQKKRKGGAT